MMSAFEILGLEPRFELSSAEVNAAHLRTALKFHPDRARDAVERDEFLRRAAQAGEAKAMLSEEIGRAEALLDALGIPRTTAQLTPAFLMETMELREQIEAAAASDDRGSIEKLAREIDSARAACVAEVAAAFREPKAAHSALHIALAQLRYVDRMRTRLAEIAR